MKNKESAEICNIMYKNLNPEEVVYIEKTNREKSVIRRSDSLFLDINFLLFKISLDVNCDVFVNGAKKENGCLRIVPRSHKRGIFEHTKTTHWPFNWLNLNPKVEIIDVEIDEPFAVFFHPNIIHGCYRNTSRDFRYSVAWEYMKWPYLPPRHSDHISNDLIQI